MRVCADPDAVLQVQHTLTNVRALEHLEKPVSIPPSWAILMTLVRRDPFLVCVQPGLRQLPLPLLRFPMLLGGPTSAPASFVLRLEVVEAIAAGHVFEAKVKDLIFVVAAIAGASADRSVKNFVLVDPEGLSFGV